MNFSDSVEKEVEKKFAKKDRKKTKKMKVSGKNVFNLKETIGKKAEKKD